MFLPYVDLYRKTFFTSALDGDVTLSSRERFFTCDRVSLTLNTLNTYEYKYVITLRWRYPSVLEKAALKDLYENSIVLYQPLSKRNDSTKVKVRALVFGYNPSEQQIRVHDLENHDATIARPKDFIVEITGVDLVPYRSFYKDMFISALRPHTSAIP